MSEELPRQKSPAYDFAVIDEAQDVSVPQLRFLAALAGDRPDGLFFAGDLGQRIFQTPFSWKALGVDVRGRSTTLRINYRTSHQIRSQADRLLGPEIADVDGAIESRRGAISVFNGPEPDIRILSDEAAESKCDRRLAKGATCRGPGPRRNRDLRSVGDKSRAPDARSSRRGSRSRHPPPASTPSRGRSC